MKIINIDAFHIYIKKKFIKALLWGNNSLTHSGTQRKKILKTLLNYYQLVITSGFGKILVSFFI